MKFVCERCHTKYSIADDKVRGKVLKVRCKSCEHVITVRESGATIDEPAAATGSKEAPMSRSGTLAAAGRAAGATASAARPRRPSGALPAVAFHDSASPAVAPPAPARRSIPTPVPTPPPVVDDGIEWYLAVDGDQTGPFARGVLVSKILAVPPSGDVHVWNAVLGDWKPPTEVPDLHADIQRRKRPLPSPAPRPPAPRPGPAPLAKAAGSNGVSHAADEAHGAAAGHAGKQNGVAALPSSDTVVARAPNGFGLEDLFGGDQGASGAVAAPAVAVPLVPASVTASQSQPVVLGAGVATTTTGGATVGLGARSGRQLKLIGGAVALVVILCGIVAVKVLSKPSAPAVAAPQPSSPQTDFSDLAAKLAKEEAEKNQAPAPAVAPPAVAPVVDAKTPLAKVDPKDALTKSGRGRVIRGKKGGPLGTSPTSPPPVGGMTPEQIQAANRFAEASGREVKAPSSSASSARSTPAQADISRVINNNRQGIQTCYQRALLRDSTLTQGKVTVRVSIGLSGKVKSVSLDAPLPFRSMEPCVRDVMSRWAFPPSSEEYGTEFPVVLQGNQ